VTIAEMSARSKLPARIYLGWGWRRRVWGFMGWDHCIQPVHLSGLPSPDS